MRKKRILILTDRLEWATFASEHFARTAGDVATFEIIHGAYDLEDNTWINQHIYTADQVWSLHCEAIFPAWLVNIKVCINSHPGFNPYNRGWHPCVFSILNGLPAGATLHMMDEKIDHGPIIDQAQVPVWPYDTAYTLWARCYQAERNLILMNLRKVVSGSFKVKRMAHDGNYNSKADYEALCRPRADEKMTADQWMRRLRALTWKGGESNLILDEDLGWEKPDYEVKVHTLTGEK